MTRGLYKGHTGMGLESERITYEQEGSLMSNSVWQSRLTHIAKLGDVPLELLRRRAAGLVCADVQQPAYASSPVLLSSNPSWCHVQ